MSRQQTLVSMIAACIVVASCKKTEAPPQASDQSLLLGAIQLQGGQGKLKTGSEFSARIEATLLGTAIRGTLSHKPGATRLDYVGGPRREGVAQVAADGRCWQRIGKVVLPCQAELAEHATRLARLLAAGWLWPLAERGDWKVKTADAELAGKPCTGLTVEVDGEELGSLLLGKESYLVEGLRMQTTLGGKTGELLGTFSEFEDHCGIKIATRREYTFLGEPLSTEKIGGVICQSIDDKVFERPEQVKHGTVEIKHSFDTPLACTRLGGPLAGVGGALNRLGDHLQKNQLAPAGAALLIHRKGPPQVKSPARYVTDVCFPVDRKAWVLPKATWKGEFILDQIVGDEVLAAFGVGDHVELTTELARLLLAEARKQGRKQAGPMTQTLFMPPDSPAEQRVSEMHLPLD